MKNTTVSQTIQEKQFRPTFDENPKEPPKDSFKPKTKNMLVLGELHRGSNTFDSVQKNTGLSNKELDTILEDLEKNGMIKVRQKQGLLGPKVELYPTDKGFKEYYS